MEIIRVISPEEQTDEEKAEFEGENIFEDLGEAPTFVKALEIIAAEESGEYCIHDDGDEYFDGTPAQAKKAIQQWKSGTYRLPCAVFFDLKNGTMKKMVGEGARN